MPLVDIATRIILNASMATCIDPFQAKMQYSREKKIAVQHDAASLLWLKFSSYKWLMIYTTIQDVAKLQKKKNISMLTSQSWNWTKRFHSFLGVWKNHSGGHIFFSRNMLKFRIYLNNAF